MLRVRPFSLILTVAFACNVHAADWPHRFGPLRNSTTTEVVPVWNDALEKAWEVPLGEGYSSPVVAGGRLFLHSKVANENIEELIVCDAESGERLWLFAYPHQPFESDVGNGPRAAPTVAQGRVYIYGITGILTCLEADSGKQIWQVNPLEQHRAKVMMFGASAAPLLEGNRIFLPVGAADAGIVALEAGTGKQLWKTPLPDPPTSVGPFTWTARDAAGRMTPQVVHTTVRGLVGLHPSDGRVLWEFPLSDQAIGTLPPPTVAGDLLLASSMVTGTIGLGVTAEGGRFVAAERWKNPDVVSYFTHAVTADDKFLFLLKATLVPEAKIDLVCLDLHTGRELWSQPNVGVYSLNLTRTGDGKLLALDDVKGEVALIQPDADGYRELARAKVCQPTIINFAIANGRLYTRDSEGVTCWKFPPAEKR